MDNSTLPTLLNPSTPLALLPPDLSKQFEANCYLVIGTLAAYLWDLLCSMGQDYRLLTQYSVNVPTLVYFVSRMATLGYVLSIAIFQVVPIPSCQTLIYTAGWLLTVATAATTLLFFFRVRAVFERRPVVVALFGLLWLGTLAGSASVPFSSASSHIPGTSRCIITSVKPFASVGFLLNTCNDTLVFFAISWRITINTMDKPNVRSFFGGRNLPHISRELLQGGQLYYLITVACGIATIATILASPLPPLLGVPNMALESAMACRVFRNIRLNWARSHLPVWSISDTGAKGGAPDAAIRTIGGTNIRRMRNIPAKFTKPVPHDVISEVSLESDCGSTVIIGDHHIELV